jgi:hypothetical protein
MFDPGVLGRYGKAVMKTLLGRLFQNESLAAADLDHPWHFGPAERDIGCQTGRQDLTSCNS